MVNPLFVWVSNMIPESREALNNLQKTKASWESQMEKYDDELAKLQKERDQLVHSPTHDAIE